MINKNHPFFGEYFRIFFFRAWFIIVILFISSLFLSKMNFPLLSGFSAILFGFSIPYTIGYLLYKLYHIECPHCYSKLKTIKNLKLSKYEAVCNKCQIIWDVGIGVDTSD